MDLKPWIEKLTILDKSGVPRKLLLDTQFAWAQRNFVETINREFNLGKPVRLIVLKARQLGLSTISEGVIFNWNFMFPGISSLVLAHEREASQSLFEKSQLFWDTWPFKRFYHIRHNSQRRLSWIETRSSMTIATARNTGSGRSYTRQAVHASEVAFWEDAEELMGGLNNTIPNRHGTIMIIESTANGVGNYYHQTWEDAVHGVNEYIPIFYPWFHHPEYNMPILSQDRYAALANPVDPVEKGLLRVGANPENLEWRRWCIPNRCKGDEDLFKQEYPATPDEAFLTTGRHVFPLDKLEECYEPMRGIRGYIDDSGGNYTFVKDPLGPLTIFRWPSRRKELGQYFVGGDPSRTTLGDGACLQVINRITLEQVAVWHGHIDPVAFAAEAAKLGYYYNKAEISTEIEGPGYATIGALLTMNYPRIWRHRWADKAPGKVSISYGWSSNYQRKHWGMGVVISFLHDHSLTIHDVITYDQMKKYVVLSDYGDMGNADKTKGNDDAVMALMIACVCNKSEGPGGILDFSPPPPPSDILGQAPWEALPVEDGYSPHAYV